MKQFFEGLPWWVRWVAIPLIALFVFGSLITSIIGFMLGLLIKVVLFAALVGGLVFLVRKFTSSSSRGDW